jgi:hypothetical protein
MERNNLHTMMASAIHCHQELVCGLTKIGTYLNRNFTLSGFVLSTRERLWVCFSVASDP